MPSPKINLKLRHRNHNHPLLGRLPPRPLLYIHLLPPPERAESRAESRGRVREEGERGVAGSNRRVSLLSHSLFLNVLYREEEGKALFVKKAKANSVDGTPGRTPSLCIRYSSRGKKEEKARQGKARQYCSKGRFSSERK